MARDSRETIADLYQAGDEVDILALNRTAYGPTDILVTPEDFHWRYTQNPAGQAIIPVIRDLHSGVVVGFIWIVPLRIRFYGEHRLTAIGTDLLIHHEYRNTFAYTKLIRRFQQVFKDENIPFHFSFVSEEVYRRQRKQTPQAVSTIRLLVKPLDFGSLAASYSTKTWKRFVIDTAGQILSPLFFRQGLTTSCGSVTVQIVDRFGPDFDDFWRQVRDKYPIIAIRDRAFLAWRFGKVSRRHYQILVARARDQMLGYAVLRCATIHGVRVGLVMDLLIADGTPGETAGICLLAEAEAYFRSQGMSVTIGLMVSSLAEYRVMRRAGYRSLPATLTPRPFRFACFVHIDEPGLTSLSARDWFVTLADYEGF